MEPPRVPDASFQQHRLGVEVAVRVTHNSSCDDDRLLRQQGVCQPSTAEAQGATSQVAGEGAHSWLPTVHWGREEGATASSRGQGGGQCGVSSA